MMKRQQLFSVWASLYACWGVAMTTIKLRQPPPFLFSHSISVSPFFRCRGYRHPARQLGRQQPTGRNKNRFQRRSQKHSHKKNRLFWHLYGQSFDTGKEWEWNCRILPGGSHHREQQWHPDPNPQPERTGRNTGRYNKLWLLMGTM